MMNLLVILSILAALNVNMVSSKWKKKNFNFIGKHNHFLNLLYHISPFRCYLDAVLQKDRVSYKWLFFPSLSEYHFTLCSVFSTLFAKARISSFLFLWSGGMAKENYLIDNKILDIYVCIFPELSPNEWQEGGV